MRSSVITNRIATPPAPARGASRATPISGQALGPPPRPSVQLAPEALDEILGTSVLPFGETLADLIYHHVRRTVLL